MSTPHKLNVTFWDMTNKPNNGYAARIPEIIHENPVLDPFLKPIRRLPLRITLASVFCLLACCLDVSRLVGIALPFAVVAGAHFWYAILHRNRLTPELTHACLCASIFGEIVSGLAVDGFGCRTIIHTGFILLPSLFIGLEPTLFLHAACRLFLWACLWWILDPARAVLCYASALVGLVAAKYMETLLLVQILSDLKLSTPRRRRTSNNNLYCVYKVRRTSLPALGGSNKSSHIAFGFQ
ncbi:uncharacterized protein LOC118204097, partial [Stegodyphus dumicola]|uniref:uncharacterized protein LOC118204097 n=1 Tax=Stegodyphus dumicola TaxID=202533 RepID=UPI0015B32255